MGRATPAVFRIPLLALAAADLAALAIRLRPWTAITSLPGQGTTGFDPAICLVTYFSLMLWISGNRNAWIQKALSAGTVLGLFAGLLLVAHLVLPPRPNPVFLGLHMGLMIGAALLWAAAGFRGARAADHFGIGIVSGAWSAMVSALMASAAILVRIDLTAPADAPLPAWSQYQGLAIGAPALQSLVHSLVSVTGFLLICPLVGGALGLICGLGQDRD